MNAIHQLRLRQRRLRKGGKLEHWAERLGISPSYLSRLERGLVGRVDFEFLERVKSLYGISDEEVRRAISRSRSRRR